MKMVIVAEKINLPFDTPNRLCIPAKSVNLSTVYLEVIMNYLYIRVQVVSSSSIPWIVYNSNSADLKS